MPPTRRAPAAPPALTDDDVVQLRSRVAAGEKPRVIVRAASAAVAAGTRGNVVRMGDPKESEYVVVRLGKDEVPFAPSELGLTTRPRAAAPSKAAPAPTPPRKSPAPRPVRSTRGKGSAKRVPPLVVTMRFRDGSWTVEAQRGARRLSKATALRPGAVSAFAEHVEDDNVREALIETVESCRAVVEERAASLRAELAQAETALRAYESRPSRARR